MSQYKQHGQICLALGTAAALLLPQTAEWLRSYASFSAGLLAAFLYLLPAFLYLLPTFFGLLPAFWCLLPAFLYLLPALPFDMARLQALCAFY